MIHLCGSIDTEQEDFVKFEENELFLSLYREKMPVDFKIPFLLDNFNYNGKAV
jgi:hypothetical protein